MSTELYTIDYKKLLTKSVARYTILGIVPSSCQNWGWGPRILGWLEMRGGRHEAGPGSPYRSGIHTTVPGSDPKCTSTTVLNRSPVPRETEGHVTGDGGVFRRDTSPA